MSAFTFRLCICRITSLTLHPDLSPLCLSGSWRGQSSASYYHPRPGHSTPEMGETGNKRERERERQRREWWCYQSYNTHQGCSVGQVGPEGVCYMANNPRLRAVLIHNATCYIGPIPQTPEVPYCYYKRVTNVIREVKINVLSYPWYSIRSDIPQQSANQHSGLELPSL